MSNNGYSSGTQDNICLGCWFSTSLFMSAVKYEMGNHVDSGGWLGYTRRIVVRFAAR